MTAKGETRAPMKFFLPKALMPFLTPTPESAWLRVVVGMRTWRTPRWAVAAASPTMSSNAPPLVIEGGERTKNSYFHVSFDDEGRANQSHRLGVGHVRI